MTDRIEEIEARLEAITPGVWETRTLKWWDGDSKDCRYMAGLDSRAVDIDDKIAVAAIHGQSEIDAAFIASAPADMRYLLDEVERLRKEVFALQMTHRNREDLSHPGVDVSHVTDTSREAPLRALKESLTHRR